MFLSCNHLAIAIKVLLTPMISISGSTSSPDNTLQNIGIIANIVYVGLTVAIVIVAIWSLALAHKQMNENKKQTLETIYNQERPILVCSYHPIADTSLKNIPLPIENVGSGIALNIRVILSYASNVNGDKLQTGYIISSVLSPGGKEMVSFDTLGMGSIQDKIDEYSFFPEDPDTSYNQRLVITYQDIFNRKHLSIFDGRLSTNWKPYVIEPNFKYGIDDVCPDWTLLGKKELKATYSRPVY